MTWTYHTGYHDLYIISNIAYQTVGLRRSRLPGNLPVAETKRQF